jgi:hypothetical protein
VLIIIPAGTIHWRKNVRCDNGAELATNLRRESMAFVVPAK